MSDGFPSPYRDEQSPGFPASPASILFQEFAGLNTKPTRPAIKDEEMSWCSGWMPIGPGNARTMYGLGPEIYTAPTGRMIPWYGFGNIAATPYCFVLLDDGSIQAVNTNTGASAQIAGPGTVTNPGPVLGFSQWGQSYILFASPQPNGYWIWDGTTFYSSGQTGPDGKTISTGIMGTTIETMSGHVWVGDGAEGFVSAPGMPSDFTPSNGGTTFSSTDSFLRVAYTAFKQTNGFLYLIADSSINQISNVNTTGSSPINTTFVNNNVDPQTGTPWPGTIQLFSRNIIFANSNGVYICYGGAVTKISDPLDGVYNTVPSHGPTTPNAAIAEIFGIACYVLLLPIIDPFTGQQTNKLFLFDGKKWWATDQDVQLNFIASQEINSVLTAYGTDGSKIYPLFTTPSANFTKVIQSKLFALPSYIFSKEQTLLYGVLANNAPSGFDLTIQIESELGSQSYVIPPPAPSVIWRTAGGQVMTWTTALGQIMNWGGSQIAVFGPRAVSAQGQLVGMTAISKATDLTLISLTTILQHFTART